MNNNYNNKEMVISIKDLKMRYGSKQVLNGINLEIPNRYSQGYQYFKSLMDNRGWVIIKKPLDGFELSDTYTVSNKNSSLLMG